MNIPITDDTLLRRRVLSFYFLLIAVPFGLIALYGDLIFCSGLWNEITHWNQQPYSPSFFENAGLVTLYFALINAGFLLLPGYARSFQPQAYVSRNSGNQFWFCSLAYNIILGAVNGVHFLAIYPGKPLFDPSGVPFWILCFPTLGAVFSALCLTTPINRHA